MESPVTTHQKIGPVLVVGAGPTGLTAAVELSRLGIETRIIEVRDKASELSRAVGIMPYSLDLLEASGVTTKLLDSGVLIKGFKVYDENSKLRGTLELSEIDHRYKFVIAMAQSTTESILEAQLAANGVMVERSVQLVSVRNNRTVERHLVQSQERVEADNMHSGVTVDLVREGRLATEQYAAVLGADGIYSTVRHCARIPFDGYDLEEEWGIGDYILEGWDYDPDYAHIFFRPSGASGLVVRLDDNKRYRLSGTTPDAVEVAPEDYTFIESVASGKFKVSCRQVPTLQKGAIYLAGDSAHAHPPVGGQGMNLGIADAVCFAQRCAQNTLDGYTDERGPIVKSFVDHAGKEAQFATRNGPLVRIIRNLMIQLVTAITPLHKYVAMSFVGLR